VCTASEKHEGKGKNCLKEILFWGKKCPNNFDNLIAFYFLFFVCLSNYYEKIIIIYIIFKLKKTKK